MTRCTWSYGVRTGSVGAAIGNVWIERRLCIGVPGRVDVGRNNKPRFSVSLPLIVGYYFSDDASERMRKCRTLFGWLSPVL